MQANCYCNERYRENNNQSIFKMLDILSKECRIAY